MHIIIVILYNQRKKFCKMFPKSYIREQSDPITVFYGVIGNSVITRIIYPVAAGDNSGTIH